MNVTESTQHNQPFAIKTIRVVNKIMTGQLEGFMKNLMPKDVHVKLVVDNPMLSCSETEMCKVCASAELRRPNESDDSILLSPVGTIGSNKSQGDLDVSDHTKGETRWNTPSPTSIDLQLGTPSRTFVRECLHPPLCDKKSSPGA